VHFVRVSKHKYIEADFVSVLMAACVPTKTETELEAVAVDMQLL